MQIAVKDELAAQALVATVRPADDADAREHLEAKQGTHRLTVAHAVDESGGVSMHEPARSGVALEPGAHLAVPNRIVEGEGYCSRPGREIGDRCRAGGERRRARHAERPLQRATSGQYRCRLM